jgi:hypothetical protein
MHHHDNAQDKPDDGAGSTGKDGKPDDKKP